MPGRLSEMRAFVAANNDTIDESIESIGKKATIRLIQNPKSPLGKSCATAYIYANTMHKVHARIVQEISKR